MNDYILKKSVIIMCERWVDQLKNKKRKQAIKEIQIFYTNLLNSIDPKIVQEKTKQEKEKQKEYYKKYHIVHKKYCVIKINQEYILGCNKKYKDRKPVYYTTPSLARAKKYTYKYGKELTIKLIKEGYKAEAFYIKRKEKQNEDRK